VLVVICVALAAAPAGALDRIYLVRHAEKVDGWPQDRDLDALWPLSQDGVRRAESLAKTLEGSGIARIYASATTRSVQTGLPLSLSAHVEIAVEPATTDPARMEGFLEELLRRHAGDAAVLIVGHSNTVPDLLARLGASPECFVALGIEQTPDGLRIDGYDGLWVVDLAQKGCAALSRRRL
jgi:broad specificity phosphatase PhoE